MHFREPSIIQHLFLQSKTTCILTKNNEFKLKITNHVENRGQRPSRDLLCFIPIFFYFTVSLSSNIVLQWHMTNAVASKAEFDLMTEHSGLKYNTSCQYNTFSSSLHHYYSTKHKIIMMMTTTIMINKIHRLFRQGKAYGIFVNLEGLFRT